MIEPTSPEHMLAILVDRAHGEPEYEPATELSKLVETADMLRLVPLEPEPEMERVARIRFREMAIARRASDRASLARRRHGRRIGAIVESLVAGPLWKTITVVVAVVVAVILSTSLARASSKALPGDATYGMKRWIEALRTSLPLSHDARAKMDLANAHRRAIDLDRALATHRPAVVGQAVLTDLVSALDSATFEAITAGGVGASATDLAVLSALRMQHQSLDLNRGVLLQFGVTTTDDARRRLTQDEQAVSARLAQFDERLVAGTGVHPATTASSIQTGVSTSPTTSASTSNPNPTDIPLTSSTMPTSTIQARDTLTPTPSNSIRLESPTPPTKSPIGTTRPLESFALPSARYPATATAITPAPRRTDRVSTLGVKTASEGAPSVATRVVPVGRALFERTSSPSPPATTRLPRPSATR